MTAAVTTATTEATTEPTTEPTPSPSPAAGPGRLRSISVSRAVAAFLLAGLVVVAVIAALLAVAQRRSATTEAIRDARTLTNLEAVDVVGPLLTDQALVPGSPSYQALDEVVRSRVLGARIVRIKIWNAGGTILYSDDRSLVAQHFGLPDDELAALRSGRTEAEVSSLDEAENRDEKQFGKLLQVYQGVQTPSGTRLLFETYQPYDVITASSRRMWETNLPILIGGLVLLYLVQAPLAYRMARRLKTTQDERESLLVATLAASDRERATIAGDLHDGVVQGLAGASYTLSAWAERDKAGERPDVDTLTDTAADLRRWVRELRSLVVTITPPALHAQGLPSALADLCAVVETRGLTVTVDVDGTEGLEEAAEVLVYRAAQEAVRNVVRHARARHLHLVVTREQPDRLVLRVSDDGRGLGAHAAAARSRGSVGLELLTRLAASQGGTLTVSDRTGTGAELVLSLPVGTP